MIEYWDPRERLRGPVSRRVIATGEKTDGRGLPATVRADARDLVELYAGRDAAVNAARDDRDLRLDPFAQPVRIGRGTSGHTSVEVETVEAVISEPEQMPGSDAEVVVAPMVESVEPEVAAPAQRPVVRWPRLASPRAVQRFLAAWMVVALLLAGTVGGGAAQQQRYRVQEGDTLESIAAEFGVDPNAIVAASWMANPPYPAPGEVLIIPEPGQSPAAAAAMAAEREGTSPWVGGAYIVEPGDSIEYISGIFGVDPYALADLNGVVEWETIQIGQRLLIPASDTATGVVDDPERRGPDTSVWVPRYVQQYNLSCEYASAFIATSAFGGGVAEEIFVGQVPLAKNPHLGYRGDINGWWGNYDDYGVYAEPLVPVLNEWGFVGEVFYSAGDAATLINHIDQGHPVITWLAYWGDTGRVFEDDGRYTVFAGMHVVVAYGYDDDGVYVSDPATGRYRFWAWDDFLWMWATVDGMGLAVYPMA